MRLTTQGYGSKISSRNVHAALIASKIIPLSRGLSLSILVKHERAWCSLILPVDIKSICAVWYRDWVGELHAMVPGIMGTLLNILTCFGVRLLRVIGRMFWAPSIFLGAVDGAVIFISNISCGVSSMMGVVGVSLIGVGCGVCCTICGGLGGWMVVCWDRTILDSQRCSVVLVKNICSFWVNVFHFLLDIPR